MTVTDLEYPTDPQTRGMSEDEWLLELADWDVSLVQELLMRDDIPHACQAAAQARMDMVGPNARDRGAAFDRVVNRLRGRPAESPKVVVNTGPSINIAADDLFTALDSFVADPTRSSLPADLRVGLLPGSLDGPPHPEDAGQEPRVASGPAQGD